jgi:hypothetical protein
MYDDSLPDVDDLDEGTFVIRNLLVLVCLNFDSLEIVGNGSFLVPAFVLQGQVLAYGDQSAERQDPRLERTT